jgi:hypothetical protein
MLKCYVMVVHHTGPLQIQKTLIVTIDCYNNGLWSIYVSLVSCMAIVVFT